MLYINNSFSFDMFPRGVLSDAYFLEFKDKESAKRFIAGREYKSLVTNEELAEDFGIQRYGGNKSGIRLKKGDEMLILVWSGRNRRYIQICLESGDETNAC